MAELTYITCFSSFKNKSNYCNIFWHIRFPFKATGSLQMEHTDSISLDWLWKMRPSWEKSLMQGWHNKSLSLLSQILSSTHIQSIIISTSWDFTQMFWLKKSLYLEFFHSNTNIIYSFNTLNFSQDTSAISILSDTNIIFILHRLCTCWSTREGIP